MFDNPPCGQVIVFAELLQKIVPTAVFQIALFLIHYQNVIVSLTTKRLTLYSAELKFSYTDFLYFALTIKVNKVLNFPSVWFIFTVTTTIQCKNLHWIEKATPKPLEINSF